MGHNTRLLRMLTPLPRKALAGKGSQEQSLPLRIRALFVDSSPTLLGCISPQSSLYFEV